MRKATKRKISHADPLAMYRTLGRVTEFTVEEQAALNLPVRLALQAFIGRTAVEADFHTLAAALNTSMVCSEAISHEVETVAKAGLAALMRVLDRYGRTGQWGLDGMGKQEIADAVDIYEQLTGLLTGGQLKTAMVEVIRRMKAGEVLEAA